MLSTPIPNLVLDEAVEISKEVVVQSLDPFVSEECEQRGIHSVCLVPVNKNTRRSSFSLMESKDPSFFYVTTVRSISKCCQSPCPSTLTTTALKW